MHLKKFCVVPYKSGRPGNSSLPLSSTRPFANKPFNTPELSTPRTCSKKALVTGWWYATIANTSNAAADSGVLFFNSKAKRM